MGINSAPGGNNPINNKIDDKSSDEKERVEIVPKGWVTTGSLTKKFNTDARTIAKEVDRYRLEHPEWIKIFRDTTGKTVVHYSPELQAIIEKRFNKESPAPLGWLTKKEIVGVTNQTYHTIETVIESFRSKHPEWFGKFQHKNHRIFEYYSPELISKIKEFSKNQEIVPIGWKNVYQISSELNRKYGVVKATAEKFKREHPDWFKEFKSKQGPMREFLSPELTEELKILLGRVGSLENPPKGWVTNQLLAKNLERRSDTIKRISDLFREKHPEWFVVYKNSDGSAREHFSPELADQIVEKIMPAENGWHNSRELAEKLNVTIEAIRKVADKLEPDFFNEKREIVSPTSGRTIIHYSPNFAQAIEDKILEKSLSPEGWMTRNQISLYTRKSIETISKIIDENIKRHPDWSNKYRSKIGRIEQYYSPELIGVIEKELGSIEKAPIGWAVRQEVTDMLQRSDSTPIKRSAENYRETNPEWFKVYLSAQSGKPHEHYAPELVDIIKKEFEQQKEAPEGWMPNGLVAKKFNRSYSELKTHANKLRPEHPEWFIRFRTKTGFHEYYSPELIDILTQEILEPPPEGWLIQSVLARELGRTNTKIIEVAERYRPEHPEWFKRYRSKRGQDDEYIAPELVGVIMQKFLEYKTAPEGWLQQADLVRETGRDYRRIGVSAKKIVEEHPEWFGKFSGFKNRIQDFYSPEVLVALKLEFASEKEAPSGWVTMNFLNKELKHSPKYLKRLLEPLRISRPQEFGMFMAKSSGMQEHYSPAIVQALKENMLESAPQGWLLNHELAKETGRAEATVKLATNKFRSEHPEWFKVYLTKRGDGEFYSPELVEIVKKEISQSFEMADLAQERKKLKQELINFVETVSEDEKIEAQQFRALVGLFGSSRVIDLLYKFHPEFKGLPVQYVKSVIAEYIGDFLVLRHGFNGSDMANAVEYLSDPSLQEGLLEVLKESCLEYFHVQKKVNPYMNNSVIVQNYIETIKEETKDLNNNNLDLVINELEEYYKSLLSINKPDRLIDTIKTGREFPDINQRINIQEISKKKKILVADEMGLGKSASVILAKESLGVKQALVIAPSNVIDTWNNYLKSYFKEGQEPRVLIVDSIDSLHQDLSGFEYILISQERLNDKYTKELLEISPDMLIVDEVHKLKNIKEGARAQNLITLAEQIQGDDKYMAILSGTPVPNKIMDVAMILKLLYPEKFELVEGKEMVETIINGDLIDLRNILIPRMQMKSLRESIEMPQYLEKPPILIELTETEKDIYGALLEEDELTASQKIQLLRQFILNPEIIDATPGIPSSKFAEFEKNLKDDFQKVNKIVVFVNNYVEGVIRGEKSLIPKLGLPSDVEIRVIEGEVSKKDREEIQKELNTSDKKILLVVSGQTADVGVDFSGGEMVYFFNEPWTKADQAQQLARVYRPGLAHDLEIKTFITEGTIEEGIHRFIALKQRSVEKLLKGIPLTELDREILKKTETQEENREVNPELASYYFNSWDRLMRIFGEVREIGEKEFMSYLDKYGKELTHGEEYAKAYFDLGNRSYQSNANRIASTLISDFMSSAQQKPENVRILDLASGPEMLKRHSPEKLASEIVSIDINPAHFSRTEGRNRVIGKLTSLSFREKSFDYLNLTFAIHYFRKLRPSQNQVERLEIFKEMNYVLKPNGRVILNLIHIVDFKDFESFKENIKLFGFKVIEDYTGEIKEGDKYKSKVVTLEKVSDLEPDFNVEDLAKKMNKRQVDGFNFNDVKSKLKDQRQIITGFKIGDKEFNVQFNKNDQKTYEEEQVILQKGEELKKDHGNIQSIPREEIIHNLFIRYRPKSSYRLFRRLRVSEGGVIIK